MKKKKKKSWVDIIGCDRKCQSRVQRVKSLPHNSSGAALLIRMRSLDRQLLNDATHFLCPQKYNAAMFLDFEPCDGITLVKTN